MKKALIIVACILLSLTGYAQNAKPPVQTNAIIAKVAGKSGGEITKEELLKADIIELYGTNKTVVSFTMIRTGNRRDPMDCSITSSNKWSDCVKEGIKTAYPGCKIYFDNIKADGLNVPSLMFVVK